MNISQIYISQSPMADHLVDCVKTVTSTHDIDTHTVYDHDSLRELISKNFDSVVVKAYDRLNPYSYKADLGKYCVLYALGGWYFDIAVRIHFRVVPGNSVETMAYRDMQNYSKTNYSVSCGAIYSQPGHPVFERAIEIVVDNCQKEHYGISPLCPTGPTVLGRAFVEQAPNENMLFGDYMYLTPTRFIPNPAFVLPDGRIHAYGKTSVGGDLEALGTNNYNTFYDSKTVYKK
jgi:mannosyltransferase OCH1-like enzyme